ncbi:hypothetical protein EVAR_2477_1 [Eumeta japonica]|uniref:Uncharacterized protein n=1 Tax=Eumeta variegata TaxID=151549 RepID=A0A4C1SNF7_EUMVA|nr:hypothetical protein EVAR_2477_1 [Eumeta japonica]
MTVAATAAPEHASTGEISGLAVRPPTADGSRSGSPDSGTYFGTARNRCRKIAWLSRHTASARGQIFISGPSQSDWSKVDPSN